MKAVKRSIWIILGLAGIFYIIPVALLQIPYFQAKIAVTITHYLEEKLGTEVQIRQVDFRMFNQLVLRDVYLEDQAGDTLLAARRLSAGFDVIPLFHKQFRFHSVEIHTFTFHLNRETPDAPLNIQYILDAFKSKKPSSNPSIDLNIRNLSLSAGDFSYRVKQAERTPGIFNPNDVHSQDIDTKIRLDKLTGNAIIAEIYRLRFREQSGVEVRRLAFDLALNADSAHIRRLDLELPHSGLNLEEIAVHYKKTEPSEHYLDNLRFNLQILPSQILLKDVGALLPVFAHFRENLEIEGGAAAGTFDDMQLTDLTVKDENDLFLAVNANVRHLNSPKPEEIYINGSIRDFYISKAGIQKMANNFNAVPVELPPVVARLGAVSMNGKISGYLNNLTTSANFGTDVGDLQAEINFGKEHQFFLKGKIATSGIRVKELLDNEDFGIAQFEIDLNTTFNSKTDVQGTVAATINQLDYKAYRYENITFSGDFTANSFKGLLNAESPDGQLAANGFVLLDGQNSEFDFSAKASGLLLDKLHFTQKYPHPELSFTMNANFKGNKLDDANGNLELRDVVFSTGEGVFTMDKFLLTASGGNGYKQLQLQSDILTGKIEGAYLWKNMPDALKQSLAAYLPSLIAAVQTTSKTPTTMQWDFSLDDTQTLSRILHLPVVSYGQSRIAGKYNNESNLMRLEADFPRLKAGGSMIEKARLDMDNENGYIELKINGISQQKKDNKLFFTAGFKALNDQIEADICWKDNKEQKYKGELNFTTQLTYKKGQNPLSASVQFQKSELVFNDSVWTLSPTTVGYRDKRVSVENFLARHNQQQIEIEGIVSPDESDRIWISLNKVNLDYVFQSLNIPALTFGGIATGQVTAKDVYHTRQLSTNLDISYFAFNHVELGDLALRGRWDDERQGVEMKGNIVKNDTSHVHVDGYLFPAKEELSILFDASNLNAAFLRKYLEHIAQGISGELTGRVRLFGSWNDPTVEGRVWANKVSFGVEFLNTRYTFSDWVNLTPDEISVQNMVLEDKSGNIAHATGSVHHHLFSDFHFNANISYQNFLVYNATSRTNPLFYGTAYATGSATIKGTEDLVYIDVSLMNNENTLITLNFMEQPDIADYDFINFVKKAKSPEAEMPLPPVAEKTGNGTDIRLNLLVNANNTATMEIIMDPVSGDKISGTGAGNMQIQYGTKTPLKVFGNYQIEKGRYNFSFQQAWYRNFEIEDGSSVNFRGDPFTADLKIKAAYTVSANLGDLDQQLILSDDYRISARNNIPVNCVLLLSGPLQRPEIKFDIGLPGATAELERQVKSYIRTDDMMNRQIVYLLVMGRFYTAPEYARSDTRNNNNLSLLTSTLSSTLSGMLGSLSSKFQLGTNFHQSYDNTEVELLLSSTLLNNRLIINGNFGYVDNPYLHATTNETPLIGDFDIEYKLTKTGDIRLKGFNHYNYHYRLTPEMTQGFGILFRKDFNRWLDFFRKKHNLNWLEVQAVDTMTVQ